MALKKSEKRLLGIAGVALLIFLLDFFVLSADKKGSMVVQAKTNKAKPSLTMTRSLPTGGSKQFESWGRDPFSIGNTPSGSSPAYSLAEQQVRTPKLKGIFWKDGKSHVIINDVILGEGEEQEGLKIHSIKGMEVLCSQGKRMYTLYWRESP